jgi:tetratricopeptide (TPR) repeat protein
VPLQSTTSDVVRIVYSLRDPQVLVALALLGVSLVAWAELSRRGYAVAALGIAWIWIAFLPTSGIVPLTHFRAVRYVAVCVFGLALFLPALFQALLQGIEVRRRELALVCIGLFLVAGLAERSWRRIPDWQSGATLFRHDVERDPLYREGYHMLAEDLVREQRIDEAKEVLDELFSETRSFEGYTGYLRYVNAIAVYCQVALHLDRPSDNLRFEKLMRPDSPALRGSDYAFYECGARTFMALNQLERALDILLGLNEFESLSRRPLYIATTAECLARLGRKEEAKEWLDRIPPEKLRDRVILDQVRSARRMLR